MSNLKVTVVGAGAVGLSTACVLQRAFPNADLTLVAADFNEATTSHVAAGYFCTTTDKAPTANLSTLAKWVAASGEYYMRLATSADADIAGVGIATLCELSESADAPEPFFAPHVFSCRRLDDEELDRLLPAAKSSGVASCYQAVTAYAQGDRYLPYLLNSLRRGSLTVRKARLYSLEEAAPAGACDLLFNCSGLGAGRLCRDPDVYPIRGQVVRVDAPLQKFALHGPGVQYVLPNRSNVVVGGTSGPGSTDLTVSDADTANILRRAERMLPSLRGARVLGAHVGLRPMRRGGTRFELEVLGGQSGAGVPVVHNYCHGAHGIGLSWGSAVHAVEMATEALRRGARPRL